MGLLSKAIRAFHASPHKFDKFSVKHLGKGEGSQVYGNGLYFAEAEPVAQNYYDIFKTNVGPFNFMGRPVDVYSNYDINQRWPDVISKLSAADKERFESIIGSLGMSGWASPKHLEHMRENYQSDKKMLALLEKKIIPHLETPPPPEAHRYEVEIATDPSRLLHWDKRIGDQPDNIYDAVAPEIKKVHERQVAARLNQQGRDSERRWSPLSTPEEMTGHDVYRSLGMIGEDGKWAVDQKQGYATAARKLMANGIDGTMYFDQWSRDATRGLPARTHNYAIWNDDIIKILRRYGIPIAAAGTAGGLLGRLKTDGSTYA